MKHLDEALLGAQLANDIQPYSHLIEEYLSTEDIMRKSEILNELKTSNNVTLYDLEYILFESYRTITRIVHLVDLIPEIVTMYRNNEIPKPILYALSMLSKEEQLVYYNLLQTKLIVKLDEYPMCHEHFHESELKNMPKRYLKKQTKITISDFEEIKEVYLSLNLETNVFS